MSLANGVMRDDSVSVSLLPDEEDLLAGPPLFRATVRMEDWRWATIDPVEITEMVLTMLSTSRHQQMERLECDVVFTDDDAITKLNRTFRGKDRPTNVLSFPADDVKVAGEPRFLGGVALAHGVMVAESSERGIPLAHHTTHLILHGVLHLLGYDHETEADQRVMEATEIEILAGLGIKDPYGGS